MSAAVLTDVMGSGQAVTLYRQRCVHFTAVTPPSPYYDTRKTRFFKILATRASVWCVGVNEERQQSSPGIEAVRKKTINNQNKHEVSIVLPPALDCVQPRLISAIFTPRRTLYMNKLITPATIPIYTFSVRFAASTDF